MTQGVGDSNLFEEKMYLKFCLKTFKHKTKLLFYTALLGMISPIMIIFITLYLSLNNSNYYYYFAYGFQ